jgi:hypothetical protein
LRLKADVLQQRFHVRSVPEADILLGI